MFLLHCIKPMCFNRYTLSCLVLHTGIFYSCICKLCGQETICTYTPSNCIKASIHYCLHFPRAVSAYTWLKPINHHRFPSVLPWSGCNFLFKAEKMPGFSSQYSFHCNYAVITHIKQSKTKRNVRVVQLSAKLTVAQLRHLGWLAPSYLGSRHLWNTKFLKVHYEFMQELLNGTDNDMDFDCDIFIIQCSNMLKMLFAFFFCHIFSGFQSQQTSKTCSVHFLHVSNTYVWFLCFCSAVIFGKNQKNFMHLRHQKH